MAFDTTNKPLGGEKFKTIGDSGTERYSGFFREEPNAKWRDDQRIENVETMRRTDATVKQLLNALKALPLAATWFVEAAGDDPEQIKHKEFVEKNIFEMKRPWTDFFREALAYWDFGFYCFEEIWEKKDGQIYLADLEPRIPHSVWNWQIPQNGGWTRGITQRIMTDEFPSTINEVQIPINKMLVFTNEKEGDDLSGQSVLRPAWKHFFIKDTLYRIASLSSERHGVGTLVITLPEGAGETEQSAAEELGANYRANESSHIVLPHEGWKVEILTPGGNPQAAQIQEQIDHHDRMIVVSALAGFLNLGSTSTGSFALSKDQSSFFIKHVEDKVKYFTEQFNKQVIKRIIDFNFGEQEKYPKLNHSPLGDIDKKEFSDIMDILIKNGIVYPSGKIRKFIHTAVGLPELTDDEIEEIEEKEIDSTLKDMENTFNK